MPEGFKERIPWEVAPRTIGESGQQTKEKQQESSGEFLN